MPNVKNIISCVKSHNTINICGYFGPSSILPEKSMISEFPTKLLGSNSALHRRDRYDRVEVSLILSAIYNF